MNESSLDWNLLRTLHVLLDEGSVSRAAARLRVTSPAVSNALHRLRETLGDPLFVRSGRGLTPTPRALQMQPMLARAFADLERSIEGPFDPQRCTQTFSIALSDADQVTLLPSLAQRFAAQFARAQLRVVTLDTLTSSGGLASPEVDVTVSPALQGEGLYRRKLLDEEGVIVARKGHPRIKRRALTRELFNSERHVDVHVLLGRPGEGNRMVQRALEQLGLRRSIAVTVPSFAAVASVVSSTDYLGGMPRRTAEFYARAVPLQVLEGIAPPLRFEMFLHWHERTQHDPAQVAFRAAIRGPKDGPARQAELTGPSRTPRRRRSADR